MSVTEKLAYIKGLCEGLSLEGDTKEGKVLLSLVDLLDDLTLEVSELNNDVMQVFEELDAIDEDLSDIEDALLYDDEDEYDDDDEDEDEDEYDDECGCGHHHHDDDEEFFYEVTCDKCGEVVLMEESALLDPNCACPNCFEKFEIEFVDECDCGDDCECGDDCDCDHDEKEED